MDYAERTPDYQAEDTDYFSRTHDDSPTESESESSDLSSSGSTSSDESRQEDSDVDSMSSSSEEEEEGNDVEVVWAKSACGVWGLGHVFDGKLYFIRDICEEKWIPKDLVPPKKSVVAPKARAKAAPSQEQSQPPNGLVWLCKQALKWLPNQPRAPLPPPHQPVQHTPCLSCKLSLCNSSKCVILVPRSSLPFLWILNTICVG